MQIDMRRSDPSLKMNRFYSVELTKDLFGQHGVHRQWGRFGTWGRHRNDWYATRTQAECALSDLVKKKLARGYLIKSSPSDGSDSGLEELINLGFQQLCLTKRNEKTEKLKLGEKNFSGFA